jgi:hypothetical protein
VVTGRRYARLARSESTRLAQAVWTEAIALAAGLQTNNRSRLAVALTPVTL